MYYEKVIHQYEKEAKAYFKEITTGDLPQKKWEEMLMKHLKKGAHILDLGCGAGNASKVFKAHGFQITMMDGAKNLCELASDYVGEKAICQRFDELSDVQIYDGVWACASLLHVPKAHLPDILHKIYQSLKQPGYFYTLFKEGDKTYSFNDLPFTELTVAQMETWLAPYEDFNLLEVKRTPDPRKDHPGEDWLHFILKKE